MNAKYYVKEKKNLVQNPINGNLSEPNNAAPFMSSSAARRPHSGGLSECWAGFEKYADKLLDSSPPVRVKYLLI